MSMTLVQIPLSLLAGFALWKMWRAFDGEERLIRYLVAAGFVTRAVVGVILYWISLLGLPIGRSLHLDYGLWFFALDGRTYFRAATAVAEEGLRAILMYPRNGYSPTYVQVLSVFTSLFGNVASVGMLLNLFCYLGMCLIVIKWMKAARASRVPGLLALGAITLLPSAMLWAMVPLKDTLFQFLVLSMLAAGVMWQRGWRERPMIGTIAGSALIMVIALFALTGIRWYVGFTVLVASAMFFLLTAAVAQKKVAALAAGIVMVVLFAQALVLSGSTFVPNYVQRALAPWKTAPEAQTVETLSVAQIATDIRGARQGFVATGGATTIGMGGALAKIDKGEAIVPAAAPVTEADEVRVAAPPVAAPPVAAEPVAAEPVAAEPVAAIAEPTPAAPTPVAPTPVAPAPVVTAPVVAAPVVSTAVAPAPAKPAPAPAAVDERIVVPVSTRGRIIAGAVAVLIPSTVARKLGLLEMGGGRGLWWFTDLDTILFDLVVLFALGFTLRRLKWTTPRNPMFWFVLLVSAVALPLIYTVTNYGTLFRLRMMVYLAVALIPLALSMANTTEKPDETEIRLS